MIDPANPGQPLPANASADEIRQAIAAHIERRRKDADFQARLRASLERHREVLELLADR